MSTEEFATNANKLRCYLKGNVVHLISLIFMAQNAMKTVRGGKLNLPAIVVAVANHIGMEINAINVQKTI